MWFNDAIEAKGMSPANEEIMRKLCSLYAMYWMVQNSGEFMAVSESHKQYNLVCCDYECYISQDECNHFATQISINWCLN